MALASSQGLANFEKCVSKLQQLLPAAVALRQRKRKDAAAAAGDSDAAATGPSAIDHVEALIATVQSNYVDEGCNAPPANIVALRGITAAEAMSGSYRELVDDFKILRDRWARAAALPPSSRTSSPSASSSASSRASSSTRRFKPVGFLNSRLPGGSNNNNKSHDGNDDDHERQQQEQRKLMMIPQEELPPSQIYNPPRFNTDDIREIAEHTREIRALQEQLDDSVAAQQVGLDTTESNVDTTVARVESGRQDLYAALKHTTFGAGVVGAILGGVLGGPAGMALGAQSGMAIAGSVGIGAVAGAYGGSKIAYNSVEASGDAEWARGTLPGSEPRRVDGGGKKK
jgi:syntaxin 17